MNSSDVINPISQFFSIFTGDGDKVPDDDNDDDEDDTGVHDDIVAIRFGSV